MQVLTLLIQAVSDGKPFDPAILDRSVPQMDEVELALGVNADTRLGGTGAMTLTSKEQQGEIVLRGYAQSHGLRDEID